MNNSDTPVFEFHVIGPFPGKSMDEVMDFICDSLHDWLNPDWKEGDDCKCEFAVTAQIVDDPVEEEGQHA